MAESSVNMKFTAQTADAQKRIAELEKELKNLKGESSAAASATTSTGASMASLAGPAAAAVAAVALVTKGLKAAASAAKECINAYKTQEQSEARLQAVLKATGKQVGMNVQELKELASATQAISRFGDEAVLEAEKVLIATQALDEEGLQRALLDSADLAEAMGTDIVSAASTMAYALQDPEQGLTRLRRAGMAFTDEEIAQVKALQDANDLYGAQSLLLDKIESKYKGVAQAVANTPTGTLDKIKNVWGDLKEDIGKNLMASLGPFFEWMYKKLSALHQWLNEKTYNKEYKQHFNAYDSEWLAENTTSETLNKNLAEWESIFQQEIEADFFGIMSNYADAIRGMDIDWERLLQVPEDQIKFVLTELFNGVLNQKQIDELVDDFKYYEDELNGTLRLLNTLRNALELQNKPVDNIMMPDFSSPASSTGEASATSPTSALDEFMKAHGSDSMSYKLAQYQKVIDQAKELRDSMYQPILPGASMMINNWELMEEWGMDAQEFTAAYKQLGEIIDSTEEKMQKLLNGEPEDVKIEEWLPIDYLAEYGTTVDRLRQQLDLLDKQISETTDPATLEYLKDIRASLQDQYDGLTEITPAVSGLNDYLEKNASLSATAQMALLDKKIAEAEAWRNSEEAGEAEIRILDEIIKKLKEQRKELEGTGRAWQDNVKDFLGTWTPAINKFQGLTSAVVEFQTQLWDSQADELEKALERDKKTGDMSEEEEKNRLAAINTLRQKSFEAEKANSIATALINGALAVTECLTEGIPGYVMAGIVAATTAVQVATISAQQYTPMAKGGIVTEATPIIAGEAGPEAIIPLSGGRGKQFLEGSGGVVINITIQGNADEEIIFHAIERAQRTGYLPKWQYA